MASIGALVAQGRFLEAGLAIESLGRPENLPPELAYVRVCAAMECRQWAVALTWLGDLLRREPSRAILHLDFAQCLHELGRDAEAEDHLLGPALAVLVQRFPTFILLARLAARKGDWEAAQRHLKTALDLDFEPAAAMAGRIPALRRLLPELLVYGPTHAFLPPTPTTSSRIARLDRG